jgi:hypothetical protein
MPMASRTNKRHRIFAPVNLEIEFLHWSLLTAFKLIFLSDSSQNHELYDFVGDSDGVTGNASPS